jgi:uncharacterized phiE125 gp8 family phage protein
VSKRVQSLVLGPTETPVTLAEAKAQLRIEWVKDDTEITQKINAATLWAEQYLQRKLVTQTWKMFLDSWPAEIKILFGDLQSVTHVKYTDSDEAQSTLSSADYLVDTDSVPGRIVLKTNETWPTDTLSPKNPIEIQFVTGYGTASAVPQDIKDAILIKISDIYTYRENYVLNNKMNVEQLPQGTEALLYNHRVWDWIL